MTLQPYGTFALVKLVDGEGDAERFAILYVDATMPEPPRYLHGSAEGLSEAHVREQLAPLVEPDEIPLLFTRARAQYRQAAGTDR